MKGKEIRKLTSNATDELKICDDTKKRWCELIIDFFFLTKVFQTDKKVQKKRPPFAILVFFFYLGFLSQPFTNHRIAEEGEGHLFNSSLPLPTT